MRVARARWVRRAKFHDPVFFIYFGEEEPSVQWWELGGFSFPTKIHI